MGYFEAGETAVRRGVYRGRVWSERALRVLEDTGAALVAACRPGAEAPWPSLYTKARADGDRSARIEAFGAMATEEWELRAVAWQDTELVLWKPPAAWFSINAFYTSAGLRNWYVNFEYPTRRTDDGFDTFDLTVDLLIAPDLSSWQWKDEDEYAHVRRLGIVSESEHQAVDLARTQALAMLQARDGCSPTPTGGRHGTGTSPGRRPGCPSAPKNADTRLPRPHELP
ncbi:DUF402 domain-containing protein [Streptomyces antimycoticus]|uniref:DUF402 domain-containing protein n=1 Tax=Streptomyces antimycoticus TaxID=68175 RepID=UPI001F438E01|nr:DUF402 domain-containing protein [Streptomyces antimycoticus]